MKKILLNILVFVLTLTTGVSQNLETYFSLAAENNPGLKASYYGFEAAMQKIAQVNVLPDPVLSFGYFIQSPETRVGPQQAKLSLSQMFPWFGTLKLQGTIAQLNAMAAYQTFIDQRNELYALVAAAYYPLFEIRNALKLEDENKAILETYKNLASTRFSSGTARLSDVLRVDILLQEAETQLSILRKKERPLVIAFNNLLNRQETDEIITPDSLAIIELPNGYSKDSISDHPLIQRLDLLSEASTESGKLAVKQGLPRIGVGLDYIVVGKRTDMEIAGNGKDIMMPMISLSLPIQRSKYAAAEQEAKAMQHAFTNSKLDMLNRLQTKYEMAWFELEQQFNIIQLLDKQVKTGKQVLDLLLIAFANSEADFEEVLSMQQQVLKFEKQKLSAQSAFMVALYQLNYITTKPY